MQTFASLSVSSYLRDLPASSRYEQFPYAKEKLEKTQEAASSFFQKALCLLLFVLNAVVQLHIMVEVHALKG